MLKDMLPLGPRKRLETKRSYKGNPKGSHDVCGCVSFPPIGLRWVGHGVASHRSRTKASIQQEPLDFAALPSTNMAPGGYLEDHFALVGTCQVP